MLSRRFHHLLDLPLLSLVQLNALSITKRATAAAPIQHGEYSLAGLGIHGPPASLFEVVFVPSSASVVAVPTASATASPGGEAKEREARRLVPLPEVVRVEEGEVSVDVVVQLAVERGEQGRRVRQLVLSAAEEGGGVAVARLPPSADGTVSAPTRSSITQHRATTAPTSLAILHLSSTSPSYLIPSLRTDLHNLRAWASALHHLSTPSELDETSAAILSASARFYPDLPTFPTARLILADILAESDFAPSLVSGGRLDSGSSWGLMQVSPLGSSQELKLFQRHAVVDRNVYSWRGADEGVGMRPLLDWKTGRGWTSDR